MKESAVENSRKNRTRKTKRAGRAIRLSKSPSHEQDSEAILEDSEDIVSEIESPEDEDKSSQEIVAEDASQESHHETTITHQIGVTRKSIEKSKTSDSLAASPTSTAVSTSSTAPVVSPSSARSASTESSIELQKKVDDLREQLSEAEKELGLHQATLLSVQYIFDEGEELTRQAQRNLGTITAAQSISHDLSDFVDNHISAQHQAALEEKSRASLHYKEETEKRAALSDKVNKGEQIKESISDNLDYITYNLVRLRIDFVEANEELIKLAKGTSRYKEVEARMKDAQAAYDHTMNTQDELFMMLTRVVKTQESDKEGLKALENSVGMAKIAAEAANESFDVLDSVKTTVADLLQKTTAAYEKAQAQETSNREANEKSGEALKTVKSVLAEDKAGILQEKQELTYLINQLIEAKQKDELDGYLPEDIELELDDKGKTLVTKKSPLERYREKIMLDDQTIFVKDKESQETPLYGLNSDSYQPKK